MWLSWVLLPPVNLGQNEVRLDFLPHKKSGHTHFNINVVSCVLQASQIRAFEINCYYCPSSGPCGVLDL